MKGHKIHYKFSGDSRPYCGIKAPKRNTTSLVSVFGTHYAQGTACAKCASIIKNRLHEQS